MTRSARKLAASVCAAVVIGSLACSGSEPTDLGLQRSPARVELSAHTISMYRGQSVTLSVLVRDSAGAVLPGLGVTWSTRDPAIATVDANGSVRANSLGATLVIARIGSVADSARVTVDPVPVATIAVRNLPPPGVSLWVGDTVRLIAEARDSAGTTVSDHPVVWHSAAPSVVSISADGLLHAVAVGTARVTATAGGKSVAADLSVIAVTIASVAVRSSGSFLLTGDTIHLEAIVRDARGRVVMEPAVSWSVDQSSVATVANGIVTTRGKGIVNVTASVGGTVGRVTLTVAPGGGTRYAAAAGADSVVLAILEQRGIVGAGLAVMVRGRLVHTRGFGWADRDAARPAGPATIFRMFSISKTVTATAILRARDQGLLRLQDSAYVIRSDATTLPGMAEDPRMRGVRIEHLLWFSSGLLYSYADPSLDCWRGGTLGREGHLRCALGLPLAFDPGSRQEYTNDGALILGRVLERVAGLAYDEYVRREIFERAGVREIRLQESRLTDRPAEETRVYPSDWAAVYGTRMAIEQFDATGSWNSSPSELLRYLRGVTGAQDHPSILSATSRALLETGPPFRVPAEPGWLGPLFWAVRESNGYRFTGIGGGDGGCMLYSHAPEGVSYVAAFNTTGQDCWELERIIGPHIKGVASWPTHNLFANRE